MKFKNDLTGSSKKTKLEGIGKIEYFFVLHTTAGLFSRGFFPDLFSEVTGYLPLSDETKVSIPNPFPKQGELPFSTGIKNVSVMINRDTIFTPNKEALIAGQSINVFTKEPKPENEAEVNALLITLFASPSERLIKSLDLYASSTIKNIKNKTSDNLQ